MRTEGGWWGEGKERRGEGSETRELAALIGYHQGRIEPPKAARGHVTPQTENPSRFYL